MSTKDRLRSHKSLALETNDISLRKLTSFVLAKIRNYEISQGCHYKATEEEVQGIISQEVKSRRELAAEYHEAADSAQDEASRRKFETLYFERLSEAGILAQYLAHRPVGQAEMSSAVRHAKRQVEQAGVPQGRQPAIIFKLARKNLSDRVFDDDDLEKEVAKQLV